MPRKDDQFPSHPGRPFAFGADRLGEDRVQESSEGVIGVTSFATGLRPIEILAALPLLPSASYPQGAVVFLTTDNKLYRSTGPTWTLAVPTVDLTGQITSAQITDLAVTTAKLNDLAVSTAKIAALAVDNGKIAALAVDSAKLADLSVTTAKLNDLAVSTAKIAALAVDNGKIAALAVDTGKLADLAVTTAKLNDLAVTNAKLGALSVNAAKLAALSVDLGKLTGQLTNGLSFVDARNRVFNASFEDDLGYWQTSIGASVPNNSANAKTGNKYLEITAAITTDVNMMMDDQSTLRYFDIPPGAVIKFGGWAMVSAGTATAVIQAITADKDKANRIGVANASTVAGAWTFVTGEFTAGAAAKYLGLKCVLSGPTGSATVRFDDVFIVIEIPGGDIVARTITADRIVAAAITANEIAALTIVAGNIAAGAIIAAKIAAHTITANEIAAGTITATEIAADTITASQIAASAITSSELAAGAVIAGKIAALTIVAGDIAASTITGAKIAATTITAANIAALTITAAEIAAGTITGAKIAATTITAANIQALTITAAEIAASTITGAKIAATTITAANIAALTITAAEIAAGTITGAKIAATTITASNIQALTITAAEIAASTITGAKIAAATITAANIVAGTITATQIAAGTITANEIAAGTITAAKIAASAVLANQLDISDGTLGTGGHQHILFRDPDVAHGITGTMPTDVLGCIGSIDTLTGGMNILGLTESDMGVRIQAVSTTPNAEPNISLNGVVGVNVFKKNGTGVQNLADTELAFTVENGVSVGSIMTVRGDGTLYSCVGNSKTLKKHVQVIGTLVDLTRTISTEGSLGTISIPAATMTTTGDAIHIVVVGRATAATAPKIRIMFGATYIDPNIAMGANDLYRIEAVVYRKGVVNVQNSHCVLDYGTTNPGGHQFLRANPLETEANAITVDFRGLTGGGTSVTIDYATVKYVPKTA